VSHAGRLSEAVAAERAASETRMAQALEEAGAKAQAQERQNDLARTERLLGAVALLDAAASLSDALDILTEVAYAEAGRAAVLLLRGSELKGWKHAGFDESAPEAKELIVPLDAASLLGEAISTGMSVSTADATGHPRPAAPAPFTLSSADRLGLAVPVIVDGKAVAVVYADDDGAGEREVPSAWPERVEMLVRHASRTFEALTARQGTSRVPGIAPHQDEESARRYARLLVSEIKLYHEASVDEGRRARDLRDRLRLQIERARHLYEERVPAQLRGRVDLFEQELVQTLADGDAALLGQGV
jgi:hypothetical protein